VKRIIAISVVANIFFTSQVILQGALACVIIFIWRTNQTLDFLAEYVIYWEIFVAFKYGSEILVLSAELLVSTESGGAPPLSPTGPHRPTSYSSGTTL